MLAPLGSETRSRTLKRCPIFNTSGTAPYRGSGRLLKPRLGRHGVSHRGMIWLQPCRRSSPGTLTTTRRRSSAPAAS
jgi:hypothetical protein